MPPRDYPVTTRRTWGRQNVIVAVLSIFIILSTLLSAGTLLAVYRVREVLRAQLQAAATNVGDISKQTIRYDFPINQRFPISTSIDVNETISVPISMTVPVRENVIVPVGPVEFPVPLNIDVPISTTITVPIKRRLPITTDVELDTTIPLEVNLQQSPVGDVLRRLQQSLEELLRQL